MPSEIRLITFTKPEIVAAISDFHLRRKLPIPKGAVLSVDIATTPDIEVTLQIRPDGEHDPVAFPVNALTLAAALVFFCINRGIPLPAQSTKHLTMRGEEVTLAISHVHHG